MERLHSSFSRAPDGSKEVLLALASNLLRDYSLQEPSDLRIRRRNSAYPQVAPFDACEKAVRQFCSKLEQSQATLGVLSPDARAILWDCRSPSAHPDFPKDGFDAALTSPPYATALPYIDTQRLSLVWLGLVSPGTISSLEAELIGSREIRGGARTILFEALEANVDGLPPAELGLCRELQAALGDQDGFRRKAVPRLLYRYFAGMGDAFTSVRRLMRKNASFGLIVGGNHTVLGGNRFEINTPAHLASIAQSRGWRHVETIPLQTYQRFGLHAENATKTEALVVLSAR